MLISSANTSRLPNVVSMSVHRLRRWPNIESPLGQSLVLPVFTHQNEGRGDKHPADPPVGVQLKPNHLLDVT